MRKLLLVFICVIVVFLSTACVTAKRHFQLSQKRDNIQSIEIYDTKQAYYEGDIHTFHDNNEPIISLAPEEFANILEDINQLEFEEEKALFPLPMDGGYDYSGYILIIEYLDGGYDILAEEGQYFYVVGNDGQGSHKYDHSDYCGEQAWAHFVEKYI